MGLFAILDMEIEIPKEELTNFIIESIWKTNAIQSIGDLKIKEQKVLHLKQ